jgi:citrate lyase subunit beta/citryl-CoA lyase
MVAVLRSMLFTPANNMRMIAKAGDRGADAVILDLEDSVPMPDKETARLFARDALERIAAGGPLVFVRINAPETGLGPDDLDWVVRPGLAGIVLPKAQTPDDVTGLTDRLTKLESERGIPEASVRVVPLLETAAGVLNAHAIATASPRVVAVAFGGVDFSRDMGVALTEEGRELSYARSHIAVAARAAAVLAIDTPCLAVRDREALAAEARSARGLGFTGKLLIHPSQVAAVNDLFAPTEEEIAAARRIVEAFDEARKHGQGAISLDGKMIDVANYRQARDLLASAETIAGRAAGADK